jgi:hypothetical protein
MVLWFKFKNEQILYVVYCFKGEGANICNENV